MGALLILWLLIVGMLWGVKGAFLTLLVFLVLLQLVEDVLD